MPEATENSAEEPEPLSLVRTARVVDEAPPESDFPVLYNSHNRTVYVGNFGGFHAELIEEFDLDAASQAGFLSRSRMGLGFPLYWDTDDSGEPAAGLNKLLADELEKQDPPLFKFG
jgi:hypothetical protein